MFDFWFILFVICGFLAIGFSIFQLCLSFYDKGYNQALKDKKNYKYNKVTGKRKKK